MGSAEIHVAGPAFRGGLAIDNLSFLKFFLLLDHALATIARITK